MGDVVFRLDYLATLGELGIYIAMLRTICLLRAVSCNCFFIARSCIHRGPFPTIRLVLAALKGSPSVVGDDGDSTQRLKMMRRLEGLDWNGLLHSRHFQRSLLVIGLDLPAQNRRMFD